MSDAIETYYEFGSWRNWAGGENIGPPFQSRDEAVGAGRREATERRAQHVVRDEHGTVVERVGPA